MLYASAERWPDPLSDIITIAETMPRNLVPIALGLLEAVPEQFLRSTMAGSQRYLMRF